MSLRLSTTGLLLALFACGADATVVWDEDVAGDLSNDRLAPTILAVGLGTNTLVGSMGGGGPTTDRDYFSFEVPAGAELSALIVNPGTGISGGSSFFAIQAGGQVTATPEGQNVGDLLAFGHYGTDAVGTNLLAALLPPGTAVLPAGRYSVWVQETGGTVAYSFSLMIGAVPEPAPLALFAGGLAALAVRRVRARQRQG